MSRDTLIPVLQSDLDAMMAERDLLRAALEDLITAAEIIDGQDSPPDTEDVEHLHETIRAARVILSKART